MEQTCNNASATLNMGSTLSSGATSITVSGEINVPSSGTFRALIESEIIKVTAVSTHVWTVVRGTEGSAAVTHTDGLTIYVILTAAAADAIVTAQADGTEKTNRRVLNFINVPDISDNSGSSRADITLPTNLSDTTANLPSAATANKKSLFLPTDGPILQRSDGTVWSMWGPLFPLTKPPAAASWTWVNQGSATVADSTAGTFLQCDLVNTDNWRLLVKTANSTPWTITAAFTSILCGNKDARISLIARDTGTSKFVVWGINYDSFNNEFKLALSTYTNPTTGNANVFFQRIMTLFPILFLKMTDDGTNRIYYISPDGVNWTQVYSEARTTWMTANQYGWGMDPGGASGFPVSATLLSWKES